MWYDPYLDERIFLARDCSQMEIRILAQYSQDKLLVSQLNSGMDIHSQVGHTIYGWPIEKILTDKKTRTIVKQLHFGIVYGLKPPGILETCLALGIKVTLPEIEKAYKEYFRRYKGVKEWIASQIEYVREHGEVHTLFGRHREIRVDDDREEGGAYWANQAINTPIQGSASDFLLLALALMWEQQPKYNQLMETMSDEIHDAVVVAPKLKHLYRADAMLQNLLEHDVVEEAEKRFGVKMVVPIVTEATVGFRFGVMVDYKRDKSDLSTILHTWIKKNAALEATFASNPLKGVRLDG